MLDDITYTPATLVIEGYNIYRDGKFVATAAANATTHSVESDGKTGHSYQLSVVYDQGESLPVTATIVDGIDNVQIDKTHPANVYSLDGILVRDRATTLSGLPQGVYIIDGQKIVIGK